MLDVAIMVEGQSGLTWARWQRLALAVEDLGFAALYRSDHLISAQPPECDTLNDSSPPGRCGLPRGVVAIAGGAPRRSVRIARSAASAQPERAGPASRMR